MSETSTNLTRSQLLVWLGQQQFPDAPLYNMVISFEIRAALDANLFRNAFQAFVADCDALRAVFEERAGRPYRRVLDRMDFDMEHIDLSDCDYPESTYLEWFEQRQGLCFDLASCAFDTALVRLAPDRFIWYLNQHHIITDGWSISLIFEATAARYRALCLDAGSTGFLDGTESSLASSGDASSFEVYAAHEHRLHTEGRNERARRHWQQRGSLGRAMNPPCFYGHGQRRSTTASDRIAIELGSSRCGALRALSASEELGSLTPDVALFQILLTVLVAYLYRISGERTLIVGAPSANRSNARERDTVGLFMQVFSLYVEIEAHETFESLHRKVRAESLVFLRHAAPGAASPESARAFNVVLNYAKVRSLSLGDTTVEQRFHHAGHGEAHHFLRLQVQDFERSNELLLELDLNRGAFEEVAGRASAGHFICTLDAFLESRSTRLDEYELLPSTERAKLLEELNQTAVSYARERPLNELFEAAVEAHPECPAVGSEQLTLSYRELDRRANRLAAGLAQTGVGHGAVVGLLLERGVDLVVAMLGVLKTGAAYMPIGGDIPQARRDYMLELGKVAVVVSNDTHADEQRAKDRLCLNVDANGDVAGCQERPIGTTGVSFDSPAYVLFTSGSTGEPKGVVCKHRSVVNLLEDFEQRYRLPDNANCAWWTSASFDVSVYEIFSALAFGHTLHIVPERARGHGRRFLEWLRAKRIQSAYAPPFMLNEISEQLGNGQSGPPLERLLVGVEPIAEETLASIVAALPQLQIINGYGPTEATICTTLYSLPRGPAPRRNTPIGRPVRNTSLYVLDEALRPVPFGAIGEIYAGGDGLACGYLNRPDLTEASFVASPFNSDPEVRLYRTGDLARYLPDANLMYVGRTDQQIKLRGQRLEPGEVEHALREHPGVRDALVVATEREGDKQLVAYLVTRGPLGLTALDWSRRLDTRLPRFMIPSAYVVLDAFPLTASGKVDRSALPPPPAEIGGSARAARAPGTVMECSLAEIFLDVLELQEIDVDAHFLELGGDSIRALQIAGKACDNGLQLAPRQIFEAGTIASLALVLQDSPQPTPPIDSGAGKPVSAREMDDVLAEFGEDLDAGPTE